MPLSLPVREAMDNGQANLLHTQQDAIANIYRDAALTVALAIAEKGRDFSNRFPKIIVE